MIKTIKHSRWQIAQESEKEFWKNKYSKETLLDLKEIYFPKAKFILKESKKFRNLNKNSKILQIGAAALDAINYLEIGKRYSLDPLADFYKKEFNLNYSGINFKKGVGENMPYKKEFFDLVILTNVLDHVQDPYKTLSEIQRVLKKQGLLYLEVDISTKKFIFLSKVWGTLHKLFGKIFNRPHPHAYSLEKIEQLTGERFRLVKKFEPVKRKQKLILNLLDKVGFSSNIYYRALYLKEDKNEN